MFDSAGAIIVPDMRVTKPLNEHKSVTVHFLYTGQLSGFFGSLVPSQVTYGVRYVRGLINNGIETKLWLTSSL